MASMIFDLRRSVATVASAVVFTSCLMSHSKASKISSLVQQHIWPPWPARLKVDENHIFCHENPRDVQAAERFDPPEDQREVEEIYVFHIHDNPRNVRYEAAECCRYECIQEVDLLNIFPYDIMRFLGGLEYRPRNLIVSSNYLF